MVAFLDRAVFAESAVSVNTFTGSFVSQARFNGYIMFSNWERRDVDKLLPPDLALGSNTSSTPDVHPIVFVFGDLVDGATLFGGFTYFTGIAYQEFAIGIPFVKHTRGAYLHTYIPRMYSTYFPPTWSGNTYYGFGKEIARLRWQGPMFLITTEDDQLLLHVPVEISGSWVRGDACGLPNFEAMRDVFAMPIVGRKANGSYVCSQFGWDFSDALVRPASARISIDAPLVAGLTPRQCHGVPAGTFQVQGMIWRLSWPFPCAFR